MIKQPEGRYKWTLVALLWVVGLLNYLDRQMLSTMKPGMQQDIPELATATNFGRLMAIFLWIYGIMSPVAGVVADKFNRKWLIISSLFVWSLVTMAMGFATSFEQLYALRALMGISEAIYIPASMALIAEYHSSKTRSQAIAIHITGIYTGQALGGFGATISDQISWQYTFGIFGVFGMTYALLLVFLMRNPPRMQVVQHIEQKPNVTRGVVLLLSRPVFWVILLYFALPGIPGWAVKNWLPTLFSQNLGIEMAKAGPLSTIAISASSLLGVIVGGKLSDRWIVKNLRARTIIGAAGISLTIPALILVGYGNSVIICVLAAVCFGVGFGMYDANNMPIVCQFVSPKHRATAYGLMNMIGVFAGAMATTVLGKFSDDDKLGTAFVLLSLLVVIAVLLQQIFLKPQSDNYQHE